MNNHGDNTKVGDLVRVYDLRGSPTDIIGIVHDVWMREHINDIHTVTYIKIIATAAECRSDWILASTVRIISKV
tara:strand:+ start:204 stop:425 length:222 start_codon:yes stop_codon:yes gene_type:complete